MPTMSVAKLIEKLQQYPGSYEVIKWDTGAWITSLKVLPSIPYVFMRFKIPNEAQIENQETVVPRVRPPVVYAIYRYWPDCPSMQSLIGIYYGREAAQSEMDKLRKETTLFHYFIVDYGVKDA